MKRILSVILIMIIATLSGCSCTNVREEVPNAVETVTAYVSDEENTALYSEDNVDEASDSAINTSGSSHKDNDNETNNSQNNSGNSSTSSSSNSSSGSSSGSSGSSGSSSGSSNFSSNSGSSASGTTSSGNLMMTDYCGMTINEMAAIWGYDYSVEKGLYKGGWKGVYYPDDRTGMIFYYEADGRTMNNPCTGNEIIAGVEFYDGDDNNTLYIHKGQKAKTSFGGISGQSGEFFESLVDGWYSYVYSYGNYEVSFSWYDEAGTRFVYSSVQIK